METCTDQQTPMNRNKFHSCLSSMSICLERCSDEWLSGYCLSQLAVHEWKLLICNQIKSVPCLRKKSHQGQIVEGHDQTETAAPGASVAAGICHFLYRSKAGGKTCPSPCQRESVKARSNLPPCNSCRVFNWEKYHSFPTIYFAV